MTSSSKPCTSSNLGRSRGTHSWAVTGACAFHNCSQEPRSYMTLTTTFLRFSLSTSAERSLSACDIVFTLFDGLGRAQLRTCQSQGITHCQ